MSSTMYVIEFTVKAKVGLEKWEGHGRYREPGDKDGWNKLVLDVCGHVMTSPFWPPFKGGVFKVKVEAERVAIYPAHIEKVVKRLDAAEKDGDKRFTWTPAVAQHYEMGGEG